jgi:glycosyltransferase involved in cell wall biosynthesis
MDSDSPSPYFSVIVPVYNRATLVSRALRSCVAQSFGDFEVVVVDDGSTDGSVEAVRAFDDRRIRLIVHERNRGRCPARNTAMTAARGRWFVFLDSDDELLPDALETIHRDAEAAPPDVTALRYSCVDEEGAISPEPPYPHELWSYERYLRWIEDSLTGARTEALPCARAATFPEIAYPDGHAEEGLYHLGLARSGRVGVSPAVVRRYRHDAPNQITRPDFRRALRFAPDDARNDDAVLAGHGHALRQHAPRFFARKLHDAALHHFMAGHRRAGLGYARRFVRLSGLSPKLAAIVTIGLIGRRPLAFASTLQSLLRRVRG